MKKILNYIRKKRTDLALLTTVEKNFFDTSYLSNREKKFCRKNGFSTSDYVVFGLRKNDYRNYLSTLESFNPRRYGESSFFSIGDNKIIFPFIFSNYFKVASNYAFIGDSFCPLLIKEKTLKEFLTSFDKEKVLICKPFSECDGHGGFFRIFKKNGDYFLNDIQISLTDLCEKLLKNKNHIIQESLTSHEYSKRIFPQSLNTIRLVTGKLKSNNEHDILVAVHRFGTNQNIPCDNFSTGGISTWIDVDTGVLGKSTRASDIDKNGNRTFFSEHPDTKAKIEGTIIPNWNEIKQKIQKFTRDFPFFNFIAWDLAINEKGELVVVEINMKTSFGLLQCHKPLRKEKLGEAILNYEKK